MSLGEKIVCDCITVMNELLCELSSLVVYWYTYLFVYRTFMVLAYSDYSKCTEYFDNISSSKSMHWNVLYISWFPLHPDWLGSITSWLAGFHYILIGWFHHTVIVLILSHRNWLCLLLVNVWHFDWQGSITSWLALTAKRSAIGVSVTGPRRWSL